MPWALNLLLVTTDMCYQKINNSERTSTEINAFRKVWLLYDSQKRLSTDVIGVSLAKGLLTWTLSLENVCDWHLRKPVHHDLWLALIAMQFPLRYFKRYKKRRMVSWPVTVVKSKEIERNHKKNARRIGDLISHWVIHSILTGLEKIESDEYKNYLKRYWMM